MTSVFAPHVNIKTSPMIEVWQQIGHARNLPRAIADSKEACERAVLDQRGHMRNERQRKSPRSFAVRSALKNRYFSLKLEQWGDGRKRGGGEGTGGCVSRT